jgi:hypothetical protein
MEDVLVELAPGRQREMPVTAQPPAGGGRARRPARSSRWSHRAVRPSRLRPQDARHRAEMREFQAAVARWVR